MSAGGAADCIYATVRVNYKSMTTEQSLKILVTGAGGYIGSVATYLFLQSGFEVVAVDNFTTGYKGPLKAMQDKFGEAKIRFYNCDLREGIGDVFDKEPGISVVVHYAASCLVAESMKDPHKYFNNNVGGSDGLLQAMTEHGVKNIVFSSTCALYGNAKYLPIDEKHPTDCNNPYGESKLMVEKMIDWYARTKGLHYVVLRYFNVCGASDDGFIGDSKRPSVLLMQNAVRGAMGIEPFYLTCSKMDTPDGTPIRDYVNVVDLNEAHLSAVRYLLDGGSNEVINLGTGTGNSVLEIVKKVQEITGASFDIKTTTPREGEADRMVASNEKAKRILNWAPHRTIEDSVKSLVKWYTDHPQGWSE